MNAQPYTPEELANLRENARFWRERGAPRLKTEALLATIDAVTRERGEIDARMDKATALLEAHVVSIETHGSGYINARMLVSHLLNILNGVTK